MRVPIRKGGKYTFIKIDPHLTEEKYQELKDKLERMLSGRPRLIEEVKRLASDGDFSENAAYQIAKGRLRGLNQNILKTEDLLKRALIIKPKSMERIGLGNKVTVEVNGKTKIYQILGSTETRPSAGIISHNSPIGSALLGHKSGDLVEIKLANGSVKYKILKVE